MPPSLHDQIKEAIVKELTSPLRRYHNVSVGDMADRIAEAIEPLISQPKL